MLRNILVFFTLLSSDCVLYAQTNNLLEKLLSADKVVIISHQDLHLRSTPEEMENGINGHWRTLRDSSGKLNECIVVERTSLDPTGIDSLVKILSATYDSETPSDKASCFDPHHAIVMYNHGTCSFVDICFDCRRYSASGDFIFPHEFLSVEEQWTRLKQFFIINGVQYSIEAKPD